MKNKPNVLRHERLDYIDKACGLAILLVVYAHILFPETLLIKWYLSSENFIYKFHMPLFMCLSGYLAFLSTANKKIKSESAYLNFQKKKFLKFLPAYLFFSIYSILVDIFYHHEPIQEVKNSIFSFFFIPTKGSAVFVWYLYVLMGFYLITPFILNLKRSSQYLLLAFGFLLTNVSLTPIFCFDFFCKFFFFFMSGGLIYKHNEQFILFLERNGKWIVLLTILLTVLDFLNHLIIPYQVICITMIPSILYISKLKWPHIISEIFITIGVSSFAIYLLNTSLLHIYYIFFKSFSKIEIGAFFIFSCLLLTIATAVLIRIIFNKFIPNKIYVL